MTDEGQSVATASKLAKPPSCKYKINIYKSMTCIPDIKLIRTDTTLDLSQKAEKNTLQRPALERLNTNPRRRQACGRWPAHISTSLRGPAPKRPRGLYARAVVTCYSRSQVRADLGLGRAAGGPSACSASDMVRRCVDWLRVERVAAPRWGPKLRGFASLGET